MQGLGISTDSDPESGTLNVVKKPSFHWHEKSKQLFEILKDSKLRVSGEDLPPGEQCWEQWRIVRVKVTYWSTVNISFGPTQCSVPLLALSACQGSEKVERLHSRPGKEMSGGEISRRVSLLLFSDSQLIQKMTLEPW